MVVTSSTTHNIQRVTTDSGDVYVRFGPNSWYSQYAQHLEVELYEDKRLEEAYQVYIGTHIK